MTANLKPFRIRVVGGVTMPRQHRVRYYATLEDLRRELDYYAGGERLTFRVDAVEQLVGGQWTPFEGASARTPEATS